MEKKKREKTMESSRPEDTGGTNQPKKGLEQTLKEGHSAWGKKGGGGPERPLEVISEGKCGVHLCP